MRKFMTKMAVKGQCFLASLKNDERGVSPIVATILTILIVALLAAIFWKYISQFFEDIWNRIINQTDTIG